LISFLNFFRLKTQKNINGGYKSVRCEHPAIASESTNSVSPMKAKVIIAHLLKLEAFKIPFFNKKLSKFMPWVLLKLIIFT